MPDRKTLEALLVRVEGAGGQDRELDFAVWNAFFPPTVRKSDVGVKLPPGFGRDTMSRALDPRPNLTSSIDAALALTERLLPGCTAEISWWPRLAGGEQPNNRHARTRLMQVDREGYGRHKTRSEAVGSTIPLAILAALLMALMQMQDENV